MVLSPTKWEIHRNYELSNSSILFPVSDVETKQQRGRDLGEGTCLLHADRNWDLLKTGA